MSVLPALGELRLREATVGRIDRHLRSIAARHPATAKGVKCVLSQMFALAVRHGALPSNPVRDTARLRSSSHPAVALTADGLHAVRAAIRAWQRPIAGKPGPARGAI